MNNLEAIMEKIEKKLDEKDELREKALKISREIIRKSGESISSIHRGEIDAAKEGIKDALTTNLKLMKAKEHPDILSAGYIENAFQELVEAFCILALMTDDDLPDPDDLKVSYSSYLLGLGDAIGELRRSILDSLKEGEIEKAEDFLEKMERIYEALMKFDYPSAVVPIRKKRDYARILIERTRGEVFLARSNKELKEKMAEVKEMMEKFEIEEKKEEKEKRVKDEEEFGLDVDSVWKS